MPPIRARDLRTYIQEQGFERGVVHTLEQLLEEYAGHRQHLRELTALCSKCIDEMDKLIQIGSHLKDDVTSMRRTIQGDEHEEQS